MPEPSKGCDSACAGNTPSVSGSKKVSTRAVLCRFKRKLLDRGLESLRSLVSAISWYGSKRPTSFWNYAVEHPDPARRLSDHNTSAFYDNFVSSRELL